MESFCSILKCPSPPRNVVASYITCKYCLTPKSYSKIVQTPNLNVCWNSLLLKTISIAAYFHMKWTKSYKTNSHFGNSSKLNWRRQKIKHWPSNEITVTSMDMQIRKCSHISIPYSYVVYTKWVQAPAPAAAAHRWEWRAVCGTSRRLSKFILLYAHGNNYVFCVENEKKGGEKEKKMEEQNFQSHFADSANKLARNGRRFYSGQLSKNENDFMLYWMAWAEDHGHEGAGVGLLLKWPLFQLIDECNLKWNAFDGA